MTLRNPKLFGLAVNNTFADIIDKNAALTTLNLPPNDLDIIRNSSSFLSQTDFVTCSKLSVPLFKTLDRIHLDTLQYNSILNNSAGFDKILLGNLTVNGKVSASSIRYKFIDGTGSSATIKFADISTSRVSSWNSTDSPTLSTSPIFYGSRVGIITTGSLGFSGSVSENRLKTTIVPEEKEFAAEVVTNKIQCNIGGSNVTLFAMKGIPLIFKGFFRDLNASISRINIGNIKPTWRIQEVNDLSKKVDFVDINSTNIFYRGSIGKERFIKYYYNPNNVTGITIINGGITDIPRSVLSNLISLNLSKNRLQIFPNIKNIAPNLKTLNFSDNQFFSSEIPTERNLNQNIVNKLPSTLESITMGRTFGGSIPQNILSGSNFPNLITLNLEYPSFSVNNSPKFSKDVNQNPCELPNVSSTVKIYNVQSNNFQVLGSTNIDSNSYNFQDLENLEQLNVRYNSGLTTSLFTINSSKIKIVNIEGTRLPIPDLRNKTQLQIFTCRGSSSPVGVGMSIYNSNGDFKFNGCTSLKQLIMSDSGVTGEFPIFENEELEYLDFKITRIEGQTGPNCLAANTISKLNKLKYFLIDSKYWNVTTPINDSIFANSNSLVTWWFRTYKKTTGPLPLFVGCPNLKTIVAPSNSFSGNLPNFATTPLIYHINLSDNNFSGKIPSLSNLKNLRFLFLQNNSFTSLDPFSNLPRLKFFYAFNNNIKGLLPDFSSCLLLRGLYLYNNQFDDYQSGYLSNNYNLKYLLLQNNNFSQTAINKIIGDLYDNYTNFNKTGLVVNLRGNAPPGGEETLEKLLFLKIVAKWSITTD